MIPTNKDIVRNDMQDKVYKTLKAKFNAIINEIIELISNLGGSAYKSQKEHNSGTDRIAEAAIKLNTDIVVNLQGDEPFIIKKAIESYIPTNNRSEIIKTTKNTVILDAYNANPSSMLLAIKAFQNAELENKVLILGDTVSYTHLTLPTKA